MNSGIERHTRVRITATIAPSGVDSHACGTWIRCSSSSSPLISPKRELKIHAQMNALTVLGTTHGISVSALKNANQLNTDAVHAGTVLTIPAG